MKTPTTHIVQSQLFTTVQTIEQTSKTFAHTINSKHLLTDLFTAYYSARKNKRRKKSQIQFEKNYEENIIDLWEQIENRSYEPLPSTVFIKTKPVIREVFAANFQDRIIHHYLFIKENDVIEYYGWYVDDLKNSNFSNLQLERIRQQINSYLGIMKHHNSYLLRKKIFHSLHAEFWKYFWYRSDYSAVGIRW